MARALVGPRMQARLIDALGTNGRVVSKQDLCRTLRLDSTRELDALVARTHTVLTNAGAPGITNVWGVGYARRDH